MRTEDPATGPRRTAAATALLAAMLLLALPLAGCIENVNDLRSRFDGDAEESVGASTLPSTNGSSPTGTLGANLTERPKPPVARVSAFGYNGALVFKSSFAADETLIPTLFEGSTTATFTASDSEAVDARATVVEHVWTIAPMSTPRASGGDDHGDHGGHSHLAGMTLDGHDPHAGHGDHAAPAAGAPLTKSGVSVQYTFPAEGGVFLVALTVKDSLGGIDTQALLVAANPVKVTKSVTFTGTIALGMLEQTYESSHSFNVASMIDDMEAKALGATLTLSGKDARAVDLDLFVRDPAGEAAGSSATETSSSETVALTGLAAGDWTAVVRATVGAAAEYDLLVEIVYQPLHPDVQALLGDAGDGHGGHAH